MSRPFPPDPENTFDGLYRRFFPAVLAIVSRRIGPRYQSFAEDITQDVMVRARLYLDTLRDSQEPGPWLFTIMNNVLNAWWARLKRRPAWFELEDTPSREDAEPDLRLFDMVLPHLSGLPSAQGDLVEAVKEFGYDIPKIAEQLRRTEKAVTNGLSKMRWNVFESLGWSDWIRFADTGSDPNGMIQPLIEFACRGEVLTFWEDLVTYSPFDTELRYQVDDKQSIPNPYLFMMHAISYRQLHLSLPCTAKDYLGRAWARCELARSYFGEIGATEQANFASGLSDSITEMQDMAVPFTVR